MTIFFKCGRFLQMIPEIILHVFNFNASLHIDSKIIFYIRLCNVHLYSAIKYGSYKEMHALVIEDNFELMSFCFCMQTM